MFIVRQRSLPKVITPLAVVSWDIQYRSKYKHVEKVDLEFMVCVGHFEFI